MTEAKRSITLVEAYEAWISERQAHVLEETTKRSRADVEAFLDKIGSDAGFTPDDLYRRCQKYVDYLAQSDQPLTIRRKLTSIKGMFNWCIRHGYLPSNPMNLVRLPPLQHKEHQLYTHEEYLRIREAAKGTENYWLVTCAYRTGLSLVDICNLKWESVDLKNLMIVTNRQKLKRKGGGRVQIPILSGSDLHQCLLILKEAPMVDAWPGPGYVCHGLALKYQANPNTVKISYDRLRAKLGIKTSFKAWRNTFISGLANSGVSTAIGCKISGHSNPAQFAEYVKPDLVALRDVVTRATDFMERKHENQITIREPNESSLPG